MPWLDVLKNKAEECRQKCLHVSLVMNLDNYILLHFGKMRRWAGLMFIVE